MKKKRKRSMSVGMIGGLWFGLSGCGVKGPPLPPVADTPEASDRPEISRAEPSPTPSPFPRPSKTPRAKKNR